MDGTPSASEPGMVGIRVESKGKTDKRDITDATGAYALNNLVVGQYRIIVTAPEGYQSTTGGNTRNIRLNTRTGNQRNVNFGLVFRPTLPWIRSYGLDMRFNNGFTNPTPVNACGGSYTALPSGTAVVGPGVIFTGTLRAHDTDPGTISEYDWKVQDTYTLPSGTSLQTSYNRVDAALKKAGVTYKDLVGTPGCTDASACSPGIALESGYYKIDEDLRLTNWVVPANQHYILIIDGNLRIGHDTLGGAIRVQNPNSSLVVIASGNIVVDESVGANLPLACPAVGASNIDGFYSTDLQFIVQSTGNCATEKMLNMSGGLVVNALNSGAEESFVNQRDFCSVSNNQFPTFTIRARPDLILNIPEELQSKSVIYQEVAP